MKDFANAEFPPEVIDLMSTALEAAVADLPEPVHSGHVTIIAESILRTASTGERKLEVLKRIALMELRLARRR
jgi:N12 class adenine-specific DNA methylase